MDVNSQLRSFGAWVHVRRKALDITQEALADLVGVAKVTIHKIETDQRRPSDQVAELLAAQLMIPENERAAFLASARGKRTVGQLIEATEDPPDMTGRARGHVPAQPTTFLGREREIGELIDLVRTKTRLLTLVGPGGSGKTRLALQVAERVATDYPDGVWFVDLSTVSDPSKVALACLRELGISQVSGVLALAQLQQWLRSRELLLILDNYEQVIDSALVVRDLLVTAPTITILVTSRVPLQLQGEQEYHLAPLAYPTTTVLPIEDVRQYDAVALFIARVCAMQPDFSITEANASTIVAICARLDGLPLAIELAAARTRLLSLEQVLNQLATAQLRLLANGARDLPARHQTIRATIDLSYSLLTPTEQLLLARLGIFVGGWTLAAAEVIGGLGERTELDVLEGLLLHSLVRRVDSNGEPRYLMLETIREYALERLQERGEAELMRLYHARFFVRLVEIAEPKLRSSAQMTWLARLDAEYPNLSGVLAWATEATPADGLERRTLGLRLAGALWYYWLLRGRFSESYHWLSEGWMDDETLPVVARARARLGSWFLWNHATGGILNDSAGRAGLALAREAGDRWLIAFALSVIRPTVAEREEAIMLARQVGDRWLIAVSLVIDVILYSFPVQVAQLREAALAAQVSGDRRLIIEASCALAAALLYSGALDESRQLLESTLPLAYELGGHFPVAQVYFYLGQALELLGDVSAARETQRKRLLAERALDNVPGIAATLYQHALLAIWQSDFTEVEKLVDAQTALHAGAGHLSPVHGFIARWVPFGLALARGDLAAAENLGSVAFDAALDAIDQSQDDIDLRLPLAILLQLGTLAAIRGDSEESAACYNAACVLMPHDNPHGWERVPGSPTHEYLASAGLPYAAVFYGATGRTWLETSLSRVLAFHYGSAPCLYDAALGRFLFLTGDPLAAAPRLHRALRYYRRSGGQAQAAQVLEGLAAVAAAHGSYTYAAQLWGATEALREQIGVPIWPVDRPAHERSVAEARARVTLAEWEAAWAAGRGLTWEQAADEALSWLVEIEDPQSHTNVVEAELCL